MLNRSQASIAGGNDRQADALRTRRELVNREIRRMIIAGELRPGQRLLQQPLAQRFGVSQSVLREALLEAQFSGLVIATGGTGAAVAPIDLAQVMQAYEVREVLEGLAARRCCQSASPAHVRELADLARQIHDLGVSGREQERAQLDRHFHERTIAIGGNGVLERLSQGYHIVRLVVLKVVPHDQVLADHLAIVEAIRAGDEDAAERAARDHVIKARELVRRQLNAREFAFPWEAPPAGAGAEASPAAGEANPPVDG